MTTVVEISNLSHTYIGGTQALNNINLTIKQGEKIAIIGHNGSGKTTLSKHFNGLLRPTTGSVKICGEDTGRKTTGELARYVGYVFQNPAYQLFCKTVREEIEFGIKNLGLTGQELRTRLEETLAFFDLTKEANRQPLAFSSGVRKLIALASVYAMKPNILLLDEPTTGQDHPGKEKVRQMLDMMSSQGHTCIVISHDMNFVARFAERVIVMAQGEILKDSTPSEIFSDPTTLDKAHVQPPQAVSLARLFPLRGKRLTPLTPQQLAQTLVEEEVVS